MIVLIIVIIGLLIIVIIGHFVVKSMVRNNSDYNLMSKQNDKAQPRPIVQRFALIGGVAVPFPHKK